MDVSKEGVLVGEAQGAQTLRRDRRRRSLTTEDHGPISLGQLGAWSLELGPSALVSARGGT